MSKVGNYRTKRTVKKSELIKIRVTPEFKRVLKTISIIAKEKGLEKWSQSDLLHVGLSDYILRSLYYNWLKENDQEAVKSDLMP